LSHRPRKRFGQHFLHDPGVIQKIVASIDPAADDLIVEIGPGEGAITIPLLDRVGTMHAIEIDRDVIRSLESRCRTHGNLLLHNADALRFDFTTLAVPGSALRIVGNLPYNISTPLLFHLLRQRDVIHDMHFMLQREVVERMAAGPGSRKYGRLTVMLAAYCRVERLFDIGPGAFRPPPRVHSSMVRLTPFTSAPFPNPRPDAFSAIVNRAFSMRRKTLRNALKGMVSVETMIAVHCDPGSRPETLTAAQFALLAAGSDIQSDGE
jgi:16S rRNA (adenine1518-N6/adenine1519-N6)-dimethyltransferase